MYLLVTTLILATYTQVSRRCEGKHAGSLVMTTLKTCIENTNQLANLRLYSGVMVVSKGPVRIVTRKVAILPPSVIPMVVLSQPLVKRLKPLVMMSALRLSMKLIYRESTMGNFQSNSYVCGLTWSIRESMGH